MFKRTSKHNKVSQPYSSTKSDAKMITLKTLNHEQNNGLLYINSIVSFAKQTSRN